MAYAELARQSTDGRWQEVLISYYLIPLAQLPELPQYGILYCMSQGTHSIGVLILYSGVYILAQQIYTPAVKLKIQLGTSSDRGERETIKQLVLDRL